MSSKDTIHVTKEDLLWKKISYQDDEGAFRSLFYDYFAPLCVFSQRFIEDPETCEDIVQNFFYKLWVRRKEIVVQTSFRNFLLTSVRNACLDYLRKQEVERKWVEKHLEEEVEEEEYDLYTTVELEQLLENALAKLPEPVASTFRMNRFEGKTYAEIAQQKGISVKTVEAYMTRALKFLRVELKDYLPFLAFFLYP